MGLTTKEFINKVSELGLDINVRENTKNPNEIEVGKWFEEYEEMLELAVLEDKEDINKDKRTISRDYLGVSLDKEEYIQLLKLVLEYKKD